MGAVCYIEENLVHIISKSAGKPCKHLQCVALTKSPTVQKSRQQLIKAYCHNIYTVPGDEEADIRPWGACSEAIRAFFD